MNKVLLTGAGGLIGSHIAELFSRNNIPLKCLVRKTSHISFLKQLNVEIVYGDILQKDSLQRALTDVSFVIHTAGKSSDWGSYQDFYKNNVTGTMNLLKICNALHINDIIITGSISSYGEENCPEPKNEESPLNSHYPYLFDKQFPSSMNYYRDTKALLTQQACEFAREKCMNLTVLEPVWVYGEREFHSGFFEYVKAVERGMKFAPGSRKNCFPVIYAPDLAEAYLIAYQKRLSGINRFIIGNPITPKMNDIYSLFCQFADLNSPKLIPKCLIYPLAFGMELIASIFSSRKSPLLTRSRVNMMYDHIDFSVAKAREILGFEAKTSLQEGISKTVKWYQENGYLKKPNRSQNEKLSDQGDF